MYANPFSKGHSTARQRVTNPVEELEVTGWNKFIGSERESLNKRAGRADEEI
jgi:hypothetical protein